MMRLLVLAIACSSCARSRVVEIPVQDVTARPGCPAGYAWAYREFERPTHDVCVELER